MTNYKHQYEQVSKMLTMYQDEIVPGMRAKIEELESYLKELESNEPLTIEELRDITESEEYGIHVWVKDLEDHDLIPAVTDLVSGHGVVAVWSYGEYKPLFSEKDYGIKWLAYRRNPRMR